MADGLTPGGRTGWRKAGAIALRVVSVVVFVLVFLVLTGIIAEPETVIENIARALLGR
jgi:hypothetical protein